MVTTWPENMQRMGRGNGKHLEEEQPAPKPDELLGPPDSGGYKPAPRHHWNYQPRDLPLFTFRTIQMMLFDPTIRLGLAMRAAPIYGVQFAYKSGEEWIEGIQSNSEDVAAFVKRQLDRIWADLDGILKAQVWGWSGGEVTYKLVNGRVEINRLLPRHADDIRPRVRKSETIGIRVLRCGSDKMTHIDLPFPKAWWHTYNPEFGQNFGESVLLGAYSPWTDKWMQGGALDTRRLFMYKDAYAGADITYPTGYMEIPGKGTVPNRDTALELVEQITAGGVTARPAEYDENGHEMWKLERAKVSTNPQHILQYPRDLDTEELRGMGVPDDVLTSDESSTGAWAGKQVPMAAFYSGLDVWIGSIIRDLDEQVIRPAVLMNYGSRAVYVIKTKPLAEQAAENQQNQQQSGEQPGGGGGPDQWEPFQGKRGGQGERNAATGAVRHGGNRMSLDAAVGRGVLSASELVKAAKKVLAIRMGSDDSGGNRWITIGGRSGSSDEGDAVDHRGGFPVEIDADGVIQKGGPKGLRGKHVSKVHQHFKRSRNAPAAKEKRYQAKVKKQSKAWDMPEEQYEQFAGEVWSEMQSQHTAREGAKKQARKTMGVTAGDVRRWENQGLDYSSKSLSDKSFDVIGRELAGEFPELGWGGGYGNESQDYDSQLWELLKEGKVDLPSRQSEEFHSEVDEFLTHLAESAEQELEDYGGGEIADEADDFDFGANAERFGLEGSHA